MMALDAKTVSSLLAIQTLAKIWFGRSAPWPDIAYADLLEACEMQGILPLFADLLLARLDGDGFPEFGDDREHARQAADLLRERMKSAAFRQAQYDAYSGAVLNNLATEGIFPIVLKGTALEVVYPEHCLRVTDDLDLYVPAIACQGKQGARFGATRSGLKSNLLKQGYKVSLNGYLSGYHVVFRKKTPSVVHSIEVHGTLRLSRLFPDAARRQWESGFVDRAVQLQESHGASRHQVGQRKVPAPADHFLFLLAHFSKHQVVKPSSFRSFMELALFLNHYEAELDWLDILSWIPWLLPERYVALLFHLLAWNGWWQPHNAELIAWMEKWRPEEKLLQDAMLDILAAPHLMYRKDGEYGWDSFGWRYPWVLKRWGLRWLALPVEAVFRMVWYRVSPVNAVRWTLNSMKSVGKRREKLVAFGLL